MSARSKFQQLLHSFIRPLRQPTAGPLTRRPLTAASSPAKKLSVMATTASTLLKFSPTCGSSAGFGGGPAAASALPPQPPRPQSPLQYTRKVEAILTAGAASRSPPSPALLLLPPDES